MRKAKLAWVASKYLRYEQRCKARVVLGFERQVWAV